jgi:hypothetical protein
VFSAKADASARAQVFLLPHVCVKGQEVAVYIMDDDIIEASKRFCRLRGDQLREDRQSTPNLIVLDCPESEVGHDPEIA